LCQDSGRKNSLIFTLQHHSSRRVASHTRSSQQLFTLSCSTIFLPKTMRICQ
jgi:hypothetical protein